MGFYGKTLRLSLAKRLSALLRRNSPEGHHIYWLKTMKLINLPPSLSTGLATNCTTFTMQSTRESTGENFPKISRVLTSLFVAFAIRHNKMVPLAT